MDEPQRNKPTGSGKVRPTTPGTRAKVNPAKPQAVDGDDFQIVDDETDLVSFSAPTPQVYEGNVSPMLVGPAHQSMFLRRTMVPILLSGGVGLPLLGGLWFKTGADSPFRMMGMGLPITLIVIGILFLVVGILNVLQLRSELREPGVLKHASPKNQ
jgi:hypothetical protein